MILQETNLGRRRWWGNPHQVPVSCPLFSCEATLWTAHVCLYVFMSLCLHFLIWCNDGTSVHLETWNFTHSSPNVFIWSSWHPIWCTLHLGIKNVLQDSFEDALETQQESPHPVHLKSGLCSWNLENSFLNDNTCHSWRTNSSRLHSGIKNVLKDSLEESWRHKKHPLLK